MLIFHGHLIIPHFGPYLSFWTFLILLLYISSLWFSKIRFWYGDLRLIIYSHSMYENSAVYLSRQGMKAILQDSPLWVPAYEGLYSFLSHAMVISCWQDNVGAYYYTSCTTKQSEPTKYLHFGDIDWHWHRFEIDLWSPYLPFGWYFIRCGTMLYIQIMGIPMGTNRAPLVADVGCIFYERNFMLSFSALTKIKMILFNFSNLLLDT